MKSTVRRRTRPAVGRRRQAAAWPLHVSSVQTVQLYFADAVFQRQTTSCSHEGEMLQYANACQLQVDRMPLGRFLVKKQIQTAVTYIHTCM
jgi:hypothetical protein